MALGRCPECDDLIGIAPTGEPIPGRGTSRYWRVDAHPDRRDGRCKAPCLKALPCPEHGWAICDGSGMKI